MNLRNGILTFFSFVASAVAIADGGASSNGDDPDAGLLMTCASRPSEAAPVQVWLREGLSGLPGEYLLEVQSAGLWDSSLALQSSHFSQEFTVEYRSENARLEIFVERGKCVQDGPCLYEGRVSVGSGEDPVQREHVLDCHPRGSF